ncbi:hypothetical protein CPB86DRAFT_872988 [Serendipita vermifera]|nr:hypothetical protein CPB86DRAFT_872988 [Serendipita vermifera]
MSRPEKMGQSRSERGIKYKFTRYARLPVTSPEFTDRVLYHYTDETYTILDGMPKSLFHVLIIPRLLDGMSAEQYRDLGSLLNGNHRKAKEMLLILKEVSKQVIALIEKEMMEKYGFTWKIWTGFHPLPSMNHLHLHVISSDFCGADMERFIQYNGFLPEVGLFLTVDQVLAWFDGSYSEFRKQSRVTDRARPIFNRSGKSAKCWKCQEAFLTRHHMKEHLWEEWNREKQTSITDSKEHQQSTMTLTTAMDQLSL